MKSEYVFKHAHQTAQRATVFCADFLARDFPEAARYLAEREGLIADTFAATQPIPASWAPAVLAGLLDALDRDDRTQIDRLRNDARRVLAREPETAHA